MGGNEERYQSLGISYEARLDRILKEVNTEAMKSGSRVKSVKDMRMGFEIFG